ncbi:MAG: hypothetical protein ACYC5Q_14780 [Thermoleophilia bacterium]
MKSVSKLTSGLKAGQKAARVGDLNALHKAMAELEVHLQVARTETLGAARSWSLSEEEEVAYFADGDFTEEFVADAGASGLQVTVEDGTIVCYPSLVKVDAAKRCVLIDRKPYRGVRPSSLVAHLKSVQARPPRFKASQFLESLYAAWDHARHLHASGRQPGTVVRVDHLYAALTIAVGSSKEYSKPEFGRDLYLLEQSGERTTRKGARVHFGRSTGTKTPSGMITVVGEDGRRVDYTSIGFEA